MLGSVELAIQDLRGVPQHYLNHHVRDFLIDLLESWEDLRSRVVQLEDALATRSAAELEEHASAS